MHPLIPNRSWVVSVLACLCVALLQSGCGGSKSPIHASDPSQVTSLNLLPDTDFLKIGESATFTMEAVFSNGTRSPMTAATWGCDNPNVATMSGGTARGTASGQATVYGQCEHGRATRLLRVTPDYDGTWAGGYFWRGCTESGQFKAEHVCAEMPVGAEAPIVLRLAQNRDRANGTVVFGAVAGDVSGTIEMPGNLRLNGAIRYEEDDVVMKVTLSDWSTMADGDRLTGTFNLLWTVDGVDGTMTVACEISSVARTNSVVQHIVAPFQPGAKAGLATRIRRLVGFPR